MSKLRTSTSSVANLAKFFDNTPTDRARHGGQLDPTQRKMISECVKENAEGAWRRRPSRGDSTALPPVPRRPVWSQSRDDDRVESQPAGTSDRDDLPLPETGEVEDELASTVHSFLTADLGGPSSAGGGSNVDSDDRCSIASLHSNPPTDTAAGMTPARVSHYEAELQEALSEKKDLENRVKQQEGEIQHLRTQVQKLRDEKMRMLAEGRIIDSEKEDEIANLTSQLLEARENTKTLEESLRASKARINRLEELLDDARAEARRAVAREVECREETRHLQRQLENFQQQRLASMQERFRPVATDPPGSPAQQQPWDDGPSQGRPSRANISVLRVVHERPAEEPHHYAQLLTQNTELRTQLGEAELRLSRQKREFDKLQDKVKHQKSKRSSAPVLSRKKRNGFLLYAAT